MITVQGLMADPIFANFRLVAGGRGLAGRVTSTGIFDWEDPKDVVKTFSPGEFVITTLSMYKDQPEEILRQLKPLFDIRVAAIGIKTLFFKSVPQEVCRMADERGVPVFLFEDTYIDDIIYVVRTYIEDRGVGSIQAEKIETLLWRDDYTRAQVEQTVRDVNPFLYEHMACLYLTPRRQKERRSADLLRELLGRWHERITSYIEEAGFDPEEVFFTAVRLEKALLVVLARREAMTPGRSIEAAGQRVPAEALWIPQCFFVWRGEGDNPFFPAAGLQ